MSERLQMGDIRGRSVLVAMLAVAAVGGAVIWTVSARRAQPMATNVVTSATSSLAASDTTR